MEERFFSERKTNLNVMIANVRGRTNSGTHTGTPEKVTFPDSASFFMNFSAP
jgi:hypothetical protein